MDPKYFLALGLPSPEPVVSVCPDGAWSQNDSRLKGWEIGGGEESGRPGFRLQDEQQSRAVTRAGWSQTVWVQPQLDH